MTTRGRDAAGAGSGREARRAAARPAAARPERASAPRPPLAALQAAAGNDAVTAMLSATDRHATGFRHWVQRTPATWAAAPATTAVAGYTGSATFWRPVQVLVARYGTLAPTDVVERTRTLHQLEAAIRAWRANQARNWWTGVLDARKEVTLRQVERLMAAEHRVLFTDPTATTELGELEGARTTADLGKRLVQLFTGSARPEHGLVVAAQVPEARLRAALQSLVYLPAILLVLARNPAAGLPASLTTVRAFLATLALEIVAPTTAGVTPSDAAREARVEQILTPPATAAARAAAAAAGGPAPTFVAARYYEDLTAALHSQMLAAWSWAEPMDSRPGLDTDPGGHVEGIATEAKRRVDALYGAFGSAAAPSLTFSAGTLEDRGTIVGDPYDMARWMVREGGGGDDVGAVQEAHHSFEDAAAARAIEDRVIAHYVGRSAPAAANEVAAMAATGMGAAERARRLRIIDRMWPGVQERGRVSVAAREGATPAETRGIYWGLFKTMIHEYIHTTEHPAYGTWYSGLLDSHHITTYQEGFTDLFTLRTWQSLFPHEITASVDLRRRVQGPADASLDLAAVGGPPGHYAELDEAQQLEAYFGAANMKAAYFRGDTAVLGGGRLPR